MDLDFTDCQNVKMDLDFMDCQSVKSRSILTFYSYKTIPKVYINLNVFLFQNNP